MKKWHAALLAISCIMAACTGRHMGDRIVAQNEAFVLTGDSLIEGNIVATASTPFFIESSLTRERLDSILERYASLNDHDRALPIMIGGKPWHGTQVNENYPQLHSKQRLVEALHNMSIDHIAAASTNETFDARGDTIGLYCAIFLSLAHLDPTRSMATLRHLVENGQISGSNGWPACASRLTWAIAAWEVYTATADKQWLAFIHSTLESSLATDIQLLLDHSTQLMRGNAGINHEALYPSWMQAADKAGTMSLFASVITMRAMEILDEADEELGYTHHHGLDAERMKAAINQLLWSERRGRYAAYLYGNIYNLRAPIIDNMAQPFTVLWNIADDGRAASLINKTPLTLYGVPVIFPWVSPVEPYFTHPTWPAIQALWTIAAAQANNDDMVRLGIASLYRVQALFQSRHITIQNQPRNDLLTAASNQGILLRVLAGLNYLPDGIEINPHIPSCFPGDKTIKGLQYMNATLDITITGTGNNVESMTFDGNPTESNFIEATISGHHQIQIKMGAGRVTHGVTVASMAISLPPPPDVVWTSDSGFITDYVTGGRYMMMMNGQFNYSIGDIAFAIPKSRNATEVSTARANKYGFGFIGKPHLIAGNEAQLLKVNPENDTIDTHIITEHAGRYFLQIDYLSHGASSALLANINSHHQGSLIMPTGNDTLQSSIIAVYLLRGRNHVVLYPLQQSSVKTASPIAMRLYKQ